MTQQHSPGPFHLGGSGRTIYDRDDQEVAYCRSFIRQEMAEANAAYIVQACNSYEELLAALQRAAPYIKTVSRNDKLGYDDNGEELNSTLYEDMLAAIAKATSPQTQEERNVTT